MDRNKRTILYCDLDYFYASVECLHNPALRGKPMAVIGDPELRHGIVLAKSYEAKRFGVQTGDALWQARQKCKDITFVPAHYDQYLRLSKLTKEIFADYSDRCESFGLDESWLDLTGCSHLFGDGETVATTLRKRIKEELGITASVGVSFNKVFAKLGSAMNKPDGTTVILHDNFRDKVWPLPVKDLRYVGKSTTDKLRSYGINTIGDLAITDVRFLEQRFGKIGGMLWQFANGLDTSPVSNIGAKSMIKSVGNSTTAPRDLVRACNLLVQDAIQLSMYSDVAKSQGQELLEEAIDDICRRYGHFAIQRGVMFTDKDLSAVNPKDDHIIFPIGFLGT